MHQVCQPLIGCECPTRYSKREVRWSPARHWPSSPTSQFYQNCQEGSSLVTCKALAIKSNKPILSELPRGQFVGYLQGTGHQVQQANSLSELSRGQFVGHLQGTSHQVQQANSIRTVKRAVRWSPARHWPSSPTSQFPIIAIKREVHCSPARHWPSSPTSQFPIRAVKREVSWLLTRRSPLPSPEAARTANEANEAKKALRTAQHHCQVYCHCTVTAADNVAVAATVIVSSNTTSPHHHRVASKPRAVCCATAKALEWPSHRRRSLSQGDYIVRCLGSVGPTGP